MSRVPNQRVFQLTSVVREIVKEQLKLLEEPITRIAVLAYKKVLEEEKLSGSNEDPFECLNDTSSATGLTESSVTDTEHSTIFIDDQECYLECEGEGSSSIRAVYNRDVDDDGQSHFGDMIGILDDKDEFWESDLASGVIVGYKRENDWVPVIPDTSIPDWNRVRKIYEE